MIEMDVFSEHVGSEMHFLSCHPVMTHCTKHTQNHYSSFGYNIIIKYKLIPIVAGSMLACFTIPENSCMHVVLYALSLTV